MRNTGNVQSYVRDVVKSFGEFVVSSDANDLSNDYETETETETALFRNNLHNKIIKQDVYDIHFIEIFTTY